MQASSSSRFGFGESLLRSCNAPRKLTTVSPSATDWVLNSEPNVLHYQPKSQDRGNPFYPPQPKMITNGPPSQWPPVECAQCHSAIPQLCTNCHSDRVQCARCNHYFYGNDIKAPRMDLARAAVRNSYHYEDPECAAVRKSHRAADHSRYF